MELEQVLAAIAQLPPAYRDALLLTAVDDLSYDETARVLDVSVACAKVRVHRARLKLAESLSRKEPA
jgi:RNA polymerase sigma-70 factor (ECF subfamily)